jgi:hypothetical protein
MPAAEAAVFYADALLKELSKKVQDAN